MPRRSFCWYGTLALLLHVFGAAPVFAAPDTSPLPPACNVACITPYGSALGTTADGTTAYSNCNAECVVFAPNQENTIYSGIKWQCVEFARRWLIRNRGWTFGDVNTAADIWKLDTYTRLADGTELFVTNHLNGSKQKPRRGDLLIYAKEFLGTGHVAVVVEVNAAQGYLRVGEQNFENRKWPASYARTIPLLKKDGRYWLLDAYLLGWKHAD